MVFASSLQGLNGILVRAPVREAHKSRRRTVTSRCSFVACLEAFEERTLLSTLMVANLQDSGAGSLRSHRGRKQRGYHRLRQGPSRHYHSDQWRIARHR